MHRPSSVDWVSGVEAAPAGLSLSFRSFATSAASVIIIIIIMYIDKHDNDNTNNM